MTRVLLEIIVSSLDDARAAAAGGADRFEMCAGLALGGLTPSMGLLAAVKAEMPVPVMFMLRPREGGMAYTEAEFAVILRDAELALAGGADGLVFGLLTDEGEVDVPRCRRLMTMLDGAPGRQAVFHRAFDVTANPDRALDQLVDLGVRRILTSGRAARAADGLDEIRRTVERAAGRIEVLPGGGIRPEGVLEVLDRTGADQVHLSITGPAADRSASANPAVRFGVDPPPTELEYRAVSEAGVRRVRAMLDAAPERGSI